MAENVPGDTPWPERPLACLPAMHREKSELHLIVDVDSRVFFRREVFQLKRILASSERYFSVASLSDPSTSKI